MKSILLLGITREESSRVKDKMTREIWKGESLFNIYLDKFEKLIKIKFAPFSDIAIAICPKDKNLWGMAVDSKVPIIERNEKSITGFTTLSEMLHFLKDRKEEYVMIVNGCMPFLRIDTIFNAGCFFYNNKMESMIAAKKCYNWYWNKDGNPINHKDPTNTATQKINPIYETVHTFHTAKIKEILENNRYWKIKPDAFFEINSKIESLDVDTEEDFEICRTILKGGD